MRLRSDTGDVVIRMLPNGRPMLFSGGHEVWGTRSRLEVERHQNFVKLERTLAAMKTFAEERKVDVTVLILPTKGEVYRWILDQRPPRPEDAESSGFAQAVLAACERVRLRCLDAKPHLVKEARRLFDTNGTLLWWRDDTHLNGCGHEAVAAFIAREVLTSGSRPQARIGSGNGCV
ncbi:MAG: hypothetical protein HY581_12165 [Nitrospirae bacterium]|nr:hypothetical protein [Nitrospirota bacterium]